MISRRKALTSVAYSSLLAIAGCDSGTGRGADARSGRSPASAEWLKANLISGNVEPRLKNGLLPSGFYQPNLGPDWTPASAQTATLISQTRAIYVMAMGYEITGDPKCLDAMKRAADFLLASFGNPRLPGRWARAVSTDGKALSVDFHAYGHAHAIFALAHAAKVSGESRYLDAAMHTWLAIDVPAVVAGRNRLYDLQGLNIAMHMFEAVFVLFRATGSKLVLGDAKALGDFIVTHCFDRQRGYFAEWLTPERAHKPNGEVCPAHSIQMSFLLSRAVDAGLPETYLEPASASAAYVARIAARDGRGLLPHTVDYAGTVRDGAQHWWCQTELLRGLAHFGIRRASGELRAQFERSLRSVRDLFVDPRNGGWYPMPNATERDKGHEWKVGYHVAMMVTEVMRLHGMRFRSGSEVLL